MVRPALQEKESLFWRKREVRRLSLPDFAELAKMGFIVD